MDLYPKFDSELRYHFTLRSDVLAEVDAFLTEVVLNFTEASNHAPKVCYVGALR